MPIYEYTCSNCNKLSDVLQKLNEGPPEHCPACGAENTLSRVVSRTSFVLKGGGWGADLYASKKKESPAAPATEGTKTTDKNGSPAGAPAAASPSTPAGGGSSGAAATPSSGSSNSGKSDSGSGG